MAFLAVLVLGLATGVPNSALKVSERNAAADRVAEKALAIGIDFDEGNPDAPRPAPVEVQALGDAAPGSWLFAQVQTPDDRIAEPPAALREWLESHDQPLAAIVAVLEKDSPEWKVTGDELAQKPSLPFLAIIRLEKVLLALALSEERHGESALAASALEASWSLGKSVALRPTMIDQIIAVAIDKFQAGALRKIPDPPLQWIGRMGGNDTWERMLDAIAVDFRFAGDSTFSDSSDPWVEISRKLPKALSDALRKRSPCEASLMSEDQMTQIVEREFSIPSSAEISEIRRIALSIILPSILSASRRAARLSVDRELSLKVLELRLERAASREKEWPSKLVLDVSAVCPEATYAYRRDGNAMALEFVGSVDSPSSGPVLPLVFHSTSAAAAPGPSQTPPEAPPLTPPPAGGMITP